MPRNHRMSLALLLIAVLATQATPALAASELPDDGITVWNDDYTLPENESLEGHMIGHRDVVGPIEASNQRSCPRTKAHPGRRHQTKNGPRYTDGGELLGPQSPHPNRVCCRAQKLYRIAGNCRSSQCQEILDDAALGQIAVKGAASPPRAPGSSRRCCSGNTGFAFFPHLTYWLFSAFRILLRVMKPAVADIVYRCVAPRTSSGLGFPELSDYALPRP